MPRPLALIIEDDRKLNEIMAITLQADFELETWADGRAAMDRLQEVTPQLVVLDLHIPGVPGREILKHIRSDERFKRTRVIVTTADDRQAEILRSEADIILLKPVSPRLLQELAVRISALR